MTLVESAVERCIPIVRRVAREHGYAIGVHGSLARDIDLIAVPWTLEASPREELVHAIVSAVGGYIRNELLGSDGTIMRNPEAKPHGRLAWSIHVAGGTYLDLSVMPRQLDSTPDELAEHRDALRDYGRCNEGCPGPFGYECKCGWQETKTRLLTSTPRDREE